MFIRTKIMCVRLPPRIGPDNLGFRRSPTERTDGQWDLAFRLYRRQYAASNFATKGQLDRDAGHDTMGQHAEPSR